VNNRWISKQTWKISAMKNRSQLNQDITDIKMASRKATQAKYQNEQTRQDLSNRRQREYKQQLQRKS